MLEQGLGLVATSSFPFPLAALPASPGLVHQLEPPRPTELNAQGTLSPREVPEERSMAELGSQGEPGEPSFQSKLLSSTRGLGTWAWDWPQKGVRNEWEMGNDCRPEDAEGCPKPPALDGALRRPLYFQ